MTSITLQCKPCKGTGFVPGAKTFSPANNCRNCDGYGYNHPPKGCGVKRRLLPGHKFYFLMALEDLVTEKENLRDYAELNGGGFLVIGEAECYEPSWDRKKNFFFTRKEAQNAIAKIRAIINAAK